MTDSLKARTGHKSDPLDKRGTCSLLFPNWMVLVWSMVISIPSLEKLTQSPVRNVPGALADETGKMEPSLANVKKRTNAQEYTDQ